MIDLDLSPWSVALAFLYAFGPWSCLGPVVGFFVAYAPLPARVRRGGRAPGRLARVGLRAALSGGADVLAPAHRLQRWLIGFRT